jgi:hypothetical protein
MPRWLKIAMAISAIVPVTALVAAIAARRKA